MPEEEKKSSTKLVDIDTSGPEVDVTVPEVKEEVVTEKEPHEETTQDSPITDDTPEKSDERVDVRDSEDDQKQSPAKEDEKLEEYSRGVQNRISKLTRKMREAERREAAALDYAQAVESNRKEMESHSVKRDSVYNKKLEESVKTGMEAAEKELAGAIESGNAPAQVEANKRIASLAFENAKIQQAKEYQEGGEVEQQQPQRRLSDEQYLPRRTPTQLPDPDPKAEDWASKNRWFGSDRAMTFTAFEIHKDLVNKEGFDPKSEEYYKEVDRRIKVDFPHKFDKGGSVNTSEPVQTVASAKRSVKPGRQTVRLTSSQVAICKKLGVPLEEYAKQLKITKEA